MPGIFISYRRADSPDATGRIYDQLVADFGRAQVFKDIDSIPLGQDFRSHLNDKVGDCAIVLAVIGPHWTDMRDEAGQRRLDDADDFVRIELEAALARKVPVVPVLVGHAPMPSTAQLPASLAQLAFRQSIQVRPDPDFHNDATRLVSALRRMLSGKAWSATGMDEPRRAASSRASFLPWAVAAVAVASTGLVSWRHFRETPAAATAPLVRFTIAPPDKTRFARTIYSTPAGLISPDGSKIVFPVRGPDGTRSLWLRSFESTVSRPLPGTENGVPGCWSPDGKNLAFSVGNKLKRIEIANALVSEVANTGTQAKCSWNREGVILARGNPMQRVSASGGPLAPANLSKVGADMIPAGQRYPEFLPDGRHYLFSTGLAEQDVWVGNLDAPNEATHLMKASSQVLYASGYLLFLNRNALLARRFNANTLSFEGDAIPVAEHVRNNVNRIGSLAAFSASDNGWLAFQPGLSTDPRVMTLLDRSGRRVGTVGEPAEFFEAVFSRDRKSIAAVITEDTRGGSTSDIWTYDVQRGQRTRLTTGPAIYNSPVWSPDGKTLVYFSYQKAGIYRKPADGSANEVLLVDNALPGSFSPDGKYLAFTKSDTRTTDIWIYPDPFGPPGTSKPFPFIQSPAGEGNAQFSPDGKWIAYQSDESGRNEIYIAPFPGPGTKRRISTDGGTRPRWNPDGRELLFLSPDGRIMSADVTLGAVLQVGTAHPLFGDFLPTNYDVSADGQRFLAVMEPEGTVEEPITVVQNWREGLGK